MRKQLLKKTAASVLSLALIVSSMTFTSLKMSKDVTAAPTTSSKLVWSDEFNGASIDTSKWGYEIGTGSSGWGNNEQQYYTNRSDNAYVSGGALHIRAKKESYGGMNYTSARLNTNGKFTFTYGYVEARIALPASQGIWPAFWMLGANIGSVGWPSCGEIDIMEAINAESKTYGTCHWNCNGHAEYGKSSGNFDRTQYHTYGLQWDNQYIRMFVDGNKIYEMYIENNAGDTDEFHKPFYLLLNVAVGGNWPGFSIDNNAFPQEMKVDYVRVYQDNPSYSSSSSNNVDGNNTSSGGNSSGNSGSTSTPSNGMGMNYAGSNSATAYVNRWPPGAGTARWGYFISVAVGTDGITALNLVLPVYNMIFAIGAMMGVGSAIRLVIERNQEHPNADGYFFHALSWALIVGLLFMFVGIFFPDKLIALLGGDAEIVAVGKNYTRIFIAVCV